MLTFKLFESSASVTHNGIIYNLNEVEIYDLSGYTTDLIDSGYRGEAIIKVNDKQILMKESDWLRLYKGTKQYINRFLDSLELILEPIH